MDAYCCEQPRCSGHHLPIDYKEQVINDVRGCKKECVFLHRVNAKNPEEVRFELEQMQQLNPERYWKLLATIGKQAEYSKKLAKSSFRF